MLKKRLLTPHVTRRQALQGLGALGAASTFSFGMPRPGFAQDVAIRVLEWGGYELPNLFDEYLSAGHATPEFSFMSSDLDTINRLRAGIFADIANPTNNAVPEYFANELVIPWDTSKIARYDSIIPKFLDIGMRGGEQYYIPVTWGYECAIYNADKVDPFENSYALLFDDRYEGKIAWWDNTINLVIAGLVLGVDDPFDITDEELTEVTAFLAEKKKNVRFMWNFLTDWEPEFIAGNIDISYGFTASWLQAKAEGINSIYMDPKEGRLVWIDGYMQLQGTQTEALNHAFVDAWLSPETGLWIIENYGYAHSNTQIDFSQADPDFIDSLNLNKPEVLASDQILLRQHIKNTRAYARAWDRVKAS